MPKIVVCTRVDDDIERLMKTIEKQYGVKIADQARLSMYIVIPILYQVLSNIENDVMMKLYIETLKNIQKRLR